MLHCRFSWKIFIAALLLWAGPVPLALPAASEELQILRSSAPSEKADFDIYFPVRDPTAVAALIESQNRQGSPEYRKWLTPQQFAERFGPTMETIAKVTSELAAHGLTVTARVGQKLHVSANAAAVEAAFGVRLSHGRFSDGTETLVADRALVMLPALAASGALIPQFSKLPPFQKHSRKLGAAAAPVPFNAISPTGPYKTSDLRQAYDYPSAQAITARGVRIGILMAGDFNPPDIVRYWIENGLPANLQPSVVSIPIDGGSPFDPENSLETHLDIQQAGGMSLGASIRLYNLPDLSFQNIIDGLNQIVNDNVTDVVNMSFGLSEYEINANHLVQFIVQLDQIFGQGTLQGITFVASSGDNGAFEVVNGKPIFTPQYPASCPLVVAVGGTNLVTAHAAGNPNSAYVSENALPDREQNGGIWGSGGGISILFSKPYYQNWVPTQSAQFRTVPDLAGHMGGCPNDAVQCNPQDSSDLEFIGGQWQGVIGTSASAPDFVGLVALWVAIRGGGPQGRLGLIHPFIYARGYYQSHGNGTSYHHSGIRGNNGYPTAVPYDLVIGNGTVDGRQFLGATVLPPAGNPGTPSNP
jgi:subtilase family serine protease